MFWYSVSKLLSFSESMTTAACGMLHADQKILKFYRAHRLKWDHLPGSTEYGPLRYLSQSHTKFLYISLLKQLTLDIAEVGPDVVECPADHFAGEVACGDLITGIIYETPYFTDFRHIHAVRFIHRIEGYQS